MKRRYVILFGAYTYGVVWDDGEYTVTGDIEKATVFEGYAALDRYVREHVGWDVAIGAREV